MHGQITTIYREEAYQHAKRSGFSRAGKQGIFNRFQHIALMAGLSMIAMLFAGSVQAQCDNPIVVRATCDALTCPGGNDGQITGRVYGGTPPYTITLSGDASATTTVTTNGGSFAFEGLPAGTFLLFVEDALFDKEAGTGCKAVEELFLFAPPELVLEAEGSTIGCAEEGEGTVSGTITGGTAPYRVRFTGPGIDQTITVEKSGDSFLFENLSEGTYTVYVRDNNYIRSFGEGCTAEATAEVVFDTDQSVETALEEEICVGDSYEFAGAVLTESGTYTETFSLPNGCDSIVTLTLTVLPNVSVSLEAEICEGESFDFGGESLTGAGTYMETLTSANGCDSTVTLTLTVLPPVMTSLEEEICEGDSFDFGGQSLTEAGTYMETLTSANGCDSTVTLTLTVLPPVMTSLEEEICEGDSFDFGGQNLTDSGTYTETFTATNGCDSIVTLILTVSPELNVSLEERICVGESFEFGGQSLTESGTYTETFTTAAGCDSTVTLTLVVLSDINTMLEEEICEGDSYEFGGQVLTEAGTYTEIFMTPEGCDSTVTLNLTLLPTFTTSIEEEICEGRSFRFGELNLIQAGTYTATFTAANGCDSTVTLTLTLRPAGKSFIEEEICEGESFEFGAQTLTLPGTYFQTLPDAAANGCDSIIELTLNVVPEKLVEISEEICAGDSFGFGGQVLTEAGTYMETFTSASGCDSTVTLVLSVLPEIMTSLEEEICAGDSIEFGGQTLTEAGTYTETFTAANGCDSTVTLILSVLPEIMTSLEEEICEGDSFTFGDQTLTEAGTYTETFTSGSGCDSTVTLLLTILPTSSFAFEKRICDGEGFKFGGETLTESGVYLDTLTAANGCDSIVTLTLTVLSDINVSLEEEICEGDSFTFGDRTLTEAGTYTDTFSTDEGCDSTVTLMLTILPDISTAVEEEICEGDSFTFGSQVLTESGTYTETFTAANGCDSTVTLTLSVLPEIATGLEAEICEGDSYTFGDRSLTEAGTYMETFTAAGGCDSIVTLVLTVLPVTNTSIEQRICEGESFEFGGETLTESGTYLDTLIAANGCDSVITLMLTILSDITVNLEEEICEGDSFPFGDQILTEAGTYTDTFSTAEGCDSTVTLQLSVLPAVRTSTEAEICEGRSLRFGDLNLTLAGTYTQTFTAANGCDSIVTLTLSLIPAPTNSIEQDICEGESFEFGAQTLTQPGIYFQTLIGAAANGCDSIIELTLNVLPETLTELEEEICEGDTYNFNGLALDEAGTYTDTLSSSAGCDSIVVLNLSVVPFVSTELEEEICEGETFAFAGQELAESGTYTDTLTAASGCDSIVVLNLTVIPTVTTAIDQQICIGESYLFAGQELAESGTYTDTLTAASGCDSLVILHLMVIPTVTTAIDQQICIGESYPFAGQELDTSGTYTDTLTAASGCDSIVVLNLMVVTEFTREMSETICEGDTYTFGDMELDSSGVYRDTIVVAEACDTIVTLNLTVIERKETMEMATICEGESFTFAGQELTEAGIYRDTSVSSNGCDSITILDLKVIEDFIERNTSQTICEGDSIFFAGAYLTMAGTYRDTIVVPEACDTIDILNLMVNPLPMVMASAADTALCTGETLRLLGTISTSGSATIQWMGPNGFSSTLKDPVREGVMLADSGTYVLKVTDNFGCMATDSVHIRVGDPFELEMMPAVDTVCTDAEIPITVEVFGGLPEYDIQWYQSIGDSTAFLGTGFTVFDSPDRGVNYYIAEVTDAGGCTVTDTAIVYYFPIDAMISPMDTVLCELPEVPYLISVINKDPDQVLTYQWSADPDIVSPLDEATVEVLPTSTNMYSVTVTNQYGCDTVLFSEVILDVCSVDITPDLEKVSTGGEATLTATACEGCTLEWSTGDTGNSITVTPVSSTTYSVTATTPNGCTCEDSGNVDVIGCLIDPNYYFVPTGFTPNGDGVNDELCVRTMLEMIPDDIRILLIIYDRWGEEVFRTENIGECWDGTYKGKNMPTEIYAYYLEVYCPESTYSESGDITLLR